MDRRGIRLFEYARSKVTKIDINVEVDVDEHPLLAWEEWLRDHIVGRIPFSK